MRMTRHDLNNILRFLNMRKLKLNALKTKYMIIGSNTRELDETLIIEGQHNEIPWSCH